MVFCTISAVCSVYNKYPFPVKFLLKSIQIYTTTYFFSYFFSVKPLLKPTNGQRRARHIYIKGVTVRFGFDNSWISQSSSVCQKQSNGNASWVYYIHPSLAFVMMSMQVIYIYTYVGLSALLVSTDRAMREPTNCGTSDRTGSTFFMHWCTESSGVKYLSTMNTMPDVDIRRGKEPQRFGFTATAIP